jgi:hypothetical protein
VLYFWHSVGNKALTLYSNAMTDLNLTDMETCYKVFRREVIDQITIEEDRFGVEPELTAKIAAMRVRVYEVGISYHGRTYAEGKKIGWRDGVRAFAAITKHSVRARVARRHGEHGPTKAGVGPRPGLNSHDRLSNCMSSIAYQIGAHPKPGPDDMQRDDQFTGQARRADLREHHAELNVDGHDPPGTPLADPAGADGNRGSS